MDARLPLAFIESFCSGGCSAGYNEKAAESESAAFSLYP
jgi:hypothetical protein